MKSLLLGISLFVCYQPVETDFYPELDEYILDVLRETRSIPSERKELLDDLAQYIREKKAANEKVNLVFICTHNSRRSQMSQVWASTAAAFYGVEDVFAFSGGTESTAFNPRAVKALKDAGFAFQKAGKENPKYTIKFGKDASGMIAFSKKYDDITNPQGNFAAVMTCSDADESCPIVPGAAARIPLHYEDPKVADGTPQEEEKYAERCKQIAIELFYVMSKV